MILLETMILRVSVESVVEVADEMTPVFRLEYVLSLSVLTARDLPICIEDHEFVRLILRLENFLNIAVLYHFEAA